MGGGGALGCDSGVEGGLGRAPSSFESDGESGELLYRHEALVDPDGVVLESTSFGELTRELQARAARPWSYPGERAVHSSAVDIPEGENRRRVYELIAGEIVPEPPTPGETDVDPRLVERLETAAPDEMLPVSFFLRDWPAWDIPLAPAPGSLPVDELAAAHEERALAIAARKALIVDRAAALVDAVHGAGGTTQNLGWGAGWLVALVPASTVPELLTRPDVRRAALEDAVPRDAAVALGDAGVPELASTDLYVDHGYTGERSSGRSSFGDITIAIAETGGMEDEAKFLCDTGAGCPGDSRLRKRLSCLNPCPTNLGNCDEETDPELEDCDEQTSIPEPSEGDHGTLAASIALGDYTDGQCSGELCGDTTIFHTTAWAEKASGVAREASLVYFRGIGGGYSGTFAETFTDSVDYGVDIMSLSLEPDSVCRVKTTTTAEAELETAYSAGIFVASCTGNNADSGGACTITSPSGIPSAFAVGSYAEQASCTLCVNQGCDAQDSTCRFDPEASRHGGGDTFAADGTAIPGSQGMVDVLGPHRLSQVTNATGDFGEVSAGTPNGCSFSTPYVAGAAAVAKDYFLAQGASWINSPGRLHTVMLAMADRTKAGFGGAPSQHTTTPDRSWGFGRLKMRAFHVSGGLAPYGYQQLTVSMTPSSPTSSTTLNGGAPLPTGTSLVKCVLHQTELMDAKTRVSNVDLRVLTWAPSGSTCGSPSIAAMYTDTATDTQALVAVSASLGGKCARAQLIPNGIHTSGVTAHVFCYFAGVDDDEPN